MDYKTKLKNITSSTTLSKVPTDSLGFLASQISHNFSNQDKIFIAENDAQINIINQQIKFFLPEQKILNFYGFDCSPYDKISPKPQILASRIKTLYEIINRGANENLFLITSVNAIVQKNISPEIVKNLGLSIKAKTKYSLSQVVDFLIAKGYERMSNANNVGEFAVRGGIVDVVIMQASDLLGYRIDFFGDEIESIKIFDPITQLSYENVKSFEVLPASEVILNQQTIANFREKYRKLFGASIDDQFYQAISEGRTFDGMEHWLALFYQQDLVSIIDFLKNPIIFHNNQIFDQIKNRHQEILELYQTRFEQKKSSLNFYNPIKPELMYFEQKEIVEKIQKNIAINFAFGDLDESQRKNSRVIDLNAKSVPDFSLASRANKKDVLEIFQDFLQNYRQKRVAVAVLSEGFKERLSRYFHDYNIALEFINNYADFTKIKLGKIASFILPMQFGFEFDDFIVIGEQAIFGEKLLRQKISKTASQRILEESLSINQGDLVVHRDHGIGKFDGIQTITALGIKTDMIKIIYGGGDNLFVPVDNINLITRYGAENPLIQLDRLGVAGWKNRREAVRKKIRVTAEELLKISAERQLKKARIYVPETFFYDEFKAKFGYVETQDQMKAIEDVEGDLQKGSPMDRLICGDVGFGKTEVAIRASAIVAKQSQVAIIAPTTILVRQHYKNFTQRFAHTDIKIAQLSRMVSIGDAKKIREEIADGSIKIIIGTHALLQKSIKFHDLGLLIIDEEQHFGVAQKEMLKKMRNNIHVLTLSATPIPRTLQMSLAGVRDLSLIATPPIDRIAVRNFVMTYDSVIVKEAIMREYNRSGKVFFVVPRVKDIEEMQPRLKNLLPDLKIRFAHGQMSAIELEDIMNDFIDGKIDVLLSTTIIESGIDISSTNTMIIYKAEMFGLSQLYQLRGRVGRGKIRGYCYFMLSNKQHLPKEAKQKLEVMQNLDDLGVGFSIASYDMDIRGSGNILGDEQSGHIKETGVELYQQMLIETIDKIKHNPEMQNNEVATNITDYIFTIKLGISLTIPTDYMQDLALRMSFYKKISNIKNAQDHEDLINEMTDRFGKIPQEVMNLFEVALLKIECKNLNINSIEIVNDGMLIGFYNNYFAKADSLMKLIFDNKNSIKLYKEHKLLFIGKFDDKSSKFKFCYEILSKLKKLK